MMKSKYTTKETLRRNYEDLQGKYLRLVHVLHDIREAVGYNGPVDGLPEIIREKTTKGKMK